MSGTKILITGGTGFIGRHLIRRLIQENSSITVLTRDVAKANSLLGHAVTCIDRLDNATHYDVIINLAGEPIASGRWTQAKKDMLYSSRLGVTSQLVSYIEGTDKKPSLFISGSAIGIYGFSEHDHFTEDSKAHAGSFSEALCNAWEEEARSVEKLGVRLCLLRTGVVLGKEGGALAKMVLPFRLGFGGKIGKGTQWMSWVHMDDVVGIICFLIHSNISGAVNVVAPNAVRNDMFTKALGRVLRRPTLCALPSWWVRLVFGQMGQELLLSGQHVIPAKLLESGYDFAHVSLEESLYQVLAG